MDETGPQLADAAGVGGNHGLQVSGSFVYAEEAKQLALFPFYSC